MLLDKVVKGKDEPRVSNSQHKFHMNDPYLQKPQCWNCWKSNTKSPTASGWVTAQVVFPALQSVSTAKMVALTLKEWDPVSRNGDMWEDFDKSEHIEPLNSVESSLTVEEVSLPTLEWPLRHSGSGFPTHNGISLTTNKGVGLSIAVWGD